MACVYSCNGVYTAKPSRPWYLSETLNEGVNRQVCEGKNCVGLLVFNHPCLNVSCSLTLTSALTEAASIHRDPVRRA